MTVEIEVEVEIVVCDRQQLTTCVCLMWVNPTCVCLMLDVVPPKIPTIDLGPSLNFLLLDLCPRYLIIFIFYLL